MKLYNKVKKDLEKNKRYNFEDERITDEMLLMLYDAVYSAKKIINKKNKK